MLPSRRIGIFLASITLGPILVGCCDPSDKIQVSVASPPQPFQFIFLVGESEGVVQALPWYLYKSDWSEIRPELNWSNALLDFTGPSGRELELPVKWPRAERYGAVIRLSDLTWKVWWFSGSDTKIESSSVLCGGGRVHLVLSRSEVCEPVTHETVAQWGVSSAYLDQYIEPQIKGYRELRSKETK